MSSQSDRLFLEDNSAILQQKLWTKLVEGKEIQEQDFQDFEVNYFVASDESSFQLKVRYPFLSEVLKHGSQALLERVWDGLPLQLSVGEDCLEVGVQMASLGEDPALREQLAQQLLATRSWLLTGPLVERLRWLREATKGAKNTTVTANVAPLPILQIQVRQLETCWIVCKPDRVLVVFIVHVEDEVDIALGRAFCQEFAETGRKASDTSLPCTFTEPKDGVPADLRSMQPTLPNVGFISLTLSDQCVRNATDQRLSALAQPVMTFRTFFNFHLKNAKSYLHSRLRKKMDNWQQAMARAKRAPRKGQETTRRTVGGKVFAPKERA
jgi:actin related protein 2/3 complex subunit 2